MRNALLTVLLGFGASSFANANHNTYRGCWDAHGNHISYLKRSGESKYEFGLSSRYSIPIPVNAENYIYNRIHKISDFNEIFDPEIHIGYRYNIEPGRSMVFPNIYERQSLGAESIKFYDGYHRDDGHLFFVEKENSIEFVWHQKSIHGHSRTEEWVTWVFDECHS